MNGLELARLADRVAERCKYLAISDEYDELDYMEDDLPYELFGNAYDEDFPEGNDGCSALVDL